MVETIDTIEKLNREEQDWKLVEANPEMLIFQTFEWCKAAWEQVLSKSAADKLWVLKWTQDGRDDVVYFPLYIDAKGTLRFIFDTDSDALNSVYSNAAINRHWCYREVADAIMAEPKIKRVWLQKMRGGSEALDYLSVFLQGGLVYKDNASSYLRITPSSDFIKSQQHMKSKDRADLKGILKQAGKFSLRVVSKQDGHLFPEKELVELRDYMVEKGWREGACFDKSAIAFARDLFEKGGCYVAVLEDCDGIQAANMILVKGGSILSWVFLYKDPRASTLLYLKFFSEQRRDNPYVFDFGVGVYSYKIGTFRPSVENTYSLRWSKSKSDFLRNLLALNVRLGKDWVKVWRR